MPVTNQKISIFSFHSATANFDSFNSRLRKHNKLSSKQFIILYSSEIDARQAVSEVTSNIFNQKRMSKTSHRRIVIGDVHGL